jgi:CRISPR-associated protein Cmr4
MYQKAFGIVKTLAPLHVGATAGEESGNLNLIFRDQFTQTGIIPGSSIRGRLRSEMRNKKGEKEAHLWYGNAANSEISDQTTESLVKFEHASILWLPVFCPGQPIVWVSSPRLLKRYQRIAGESLKNIDPPDEYTASNTLKDVIQVEGREKLFFNFGFLTIEEKDNLSKWFPLGEELPAVVVGDDEIAMIHDMALYRQSRVALEDDMKKVKKGQFFNVEALPEDTILVFPVAIKPNKEPQKWQPLTEANIDIYLGGLESIGFGHCEMTFKEI